MKWVVVAVAVAGILPCVNWLRANQRHMLKVWMLIGFLPFGLTILPQLDVALIDWAGWRGYTQGALITVLDVLALAIYLSQPRSRHVLPFRLSMAFYFLTVVASAFQSDPPMASLFYAWQLARMFLIYAIVARGVGDTDVIPALLVGMAAGLSFEALVVVFQRFGGGGIRVGGTFGHPNLLGLVSHMIVFPLFALLLAGQRGWPTIAAPLSGAIIAALGASRAALGLAGMGFVLLFVISAFRRWTSRKALLAVCGVFAVAALSPVALSVLQNRFAVESLDDEYDERAAFNAAAIMILSDHPMGIGANTFVVVANVGGYYTRAGVSPNSGSMGAIVHNVYFLVAAETGYLGLFALAILLFRLITSSLVCGWRHRLDPRGDLLLGLGVALVVVAIHIYFEWVFFLAPVQYLFAMTAGLVARQTLALGYWRSGGQRRHG